jgi:hypothetical protein
MTKIPNLSDLVPNQNSSRFWLIHRGTFIYDPRALEVTQRFGQLVQWRLTASLTHACVMTTGGPDPRITTGSVARATMSSCHKAAAAASARYGRVIAGRHVLNASSCASLHLPVPCCRWNQHGRRITVTWSETAAARNGPADCLTPDWVSTTDQTGAAPLLVMPATRSTHIQMLAAGHGRDARSSLA